MLWFGHKNTTKRIDSFVSLCRLFLLWLFWLAENHHSTNIKVLTKLHTRSSFQLKHERSVSEGKTMAVRYDSKYIEVSAVLNHKVDELLVGILRQIRLKRHDSRAAAARRRNKCSDENGCVPVSV